MLVSFRIIINEVLWIEVIVLCITILQNINKKAVANKVRSITLTSSIFVQSCFKNVEEDISYKNFCINRTCESIKPLSCLCPPLPRSRFGCLKVPDIENSDSLYLPSPPLPPHSQSPLPSAPPSLSAPPAARVCDHARSRMHSQPPTIIYGREKQLIY